MDRQGRFKKTHPFDVEHGVVVPYQGGFIHKVQLVYVWVLNLPVIATNELAICGVRLHQFKGC